MIAIIDYNAGNLKSVEKALHFLGEECVITRDFHEIEAADKVILPGVGAFGDAMEQLKKYELDKVIHEVAAENKPFLGICLGLQLLFEGSDESQGVEGVHVLDGEIVRIPDQPGLKIPHIGWNSLHLQNNGRLFTGLEENPYVYFVHSYYLKAKDEQIVKATTQYSIYDSRIGRTGQCIRLSVSSGEKRNCGIIHFKEFCRTYREESDNVYKENYPLSGCE